MVNIFIPPVFENEEKNRVARLLNVILWTVVLAVTGLAVVQYLTIGQFHGVTASLVVTALVGLVLLHRGYVSSASLVLILSSWAVLSYNAWNENGIQDTSFFGQIIVVLVAGLLLGWKTSLVMAGFTIVVGWGLAMGETIGLVTPADSGPYSLAAETTVVFAVSAVVLALTTAGLSNALARAHKNERNLTQSNQELQAIKTFLEERVTERTRGLETVAALSERLNAILNVNQLLEELVNQVKDTFDYYHVHIYLVDTQQKLLVMRAGVGEAGAAMKAQGHAIAINAPTSLVARAARTGQIVSVENVRQASDWLPNPLLPDTYSEMAVPIVLEGQTVGVLDVQQDKIGSLGDTDAYLLRVLANQIAVAIRNARLFAGVEESLARARAVEERYLAQSWQSFEETQRRAYRLVSAGSTGESLTEPEMLEFSQLAFEQREPVQMINHSNAHTILAPVTLANKTIGSFQLHRLGQNEQPWTEDDLALVQAVLDQVAQAAENLRLFNETRERASREQEIREITDKLRAAPNLDSLLEIAARELGHRLGVRHTVLELGVDQDNSNKPQINGRH